MVVLEIDNDSVRTSFSDKKQVSYSFVERLVLINFLKNMLGNSLKNEWYSENEIQDFLESYLETFDQNNTINL